MSIDLSGWLKRIITLPAAHNSLADVLGADAAKVVAGLAHDAIASAAANALGSIVLTGITGVNAIQSHVSAEVTKALKDISPALAVHVSNSINTAIGNAETVVSEQIPGIVEAIVHGVSGVLKVS